jgi:endonuclease VIII
VPEGHTLHRLARVGSPQGRFTDGAATVDGHVLRKATAWGKHLFHHYDGASVVHIHLGLYGTFTEFEATDSYAIPDPVGQVRMRMIGADYGTDLRGPTVCEVIAEPEIADVVAKLGPDPLRPDADPARAWTRIAKSRRPIGALLMDQSILAGVGNVYRSELLYRHRIDPFRPGLTITADEFDAMWTDLVALMKVGVRRGRIIVVRPEDDHGSPSYREGRPRTYVYRRVGEACRVCGTTVRSVELEGRNLFWCPTCQG